PSGEVKRITNDYNDYFRYDMTADNSLLAAEVNKVMGNIWELPLDDSSRPRKIAQVTLGLGNYSFVGFGPDGKILYSSRTVEGEHIWIMEAAGSKPRQLTFGHNRNVAPAASPDGRRIAFMSLRDGKFKIYQMGLDGGEVKQLTDGDSDYYPTYSPDGKWIVY